MRHGEYCFHTFTKENAVIWKDYDAKSHILHDSVYMEDPEGGTLWRQKVDQWCHGLGGGPRER